MFLNRYLYRSRALAALIVTTSILVPLAGRADPSTAPTSKPAPAPAVQANTSVAPRTDAAAPAAPSRDEEEMARAEKDREAFFSAHVAALRAGLQLTQDQQVLWPPVEAAARDLAALRHAHGSDREDSPAQKPTSSVDRLMRRGDHLVRRGEALKKLAAATGPLLASLSADQKERLPMLLHGLEPRRVMARAFALQDDRMDQGWGERSKGDDLRRGNRDAMRQGMMDRRDRGRDDRADGDEGRSRMDHGWMERDGSREAGRFGAYRQGTHEEQADRGDDDLGMRRHHHHHDEEDGDDMPSHR